MIGGEMASSLFTPLSIYGSYKRRKGKEEQSKFKPRKRKKLVSKSVIAEKVLCAEWILDQTQKAE
ncbi:hypothetical protein RchiOBHm_Chr5g0079701 [Rosa chinensis]|uniref:Uncharacterized protein n=1 Tax=Rosa chinensis TaxID=74649 RepID=A0A2P6QMK5_ROSCH|nr:hypothetical protein RchiOBHm_Chr5g0079701 [Rosa chinensis]